MAFIVLFILFSCQREEAVFSAFDELHGLRLYATHHEFEILHNGFNTAEGTYELQGDTLIYLTYNEEEVIPNDKQGSQSAMDVLPRSISIDRASKKVHSQDDKQSFCADITIDRLKK